MALLTRGGHLGKAEAQFSILNFGTGQSNALRGLRLMQYLAHGPSPVMGGPPQSGPLECNKSLPRKSSADSAQEGRQTARFSAVAAICRAGAWSGIGFPQDPHDGKSSNKAGWKSESNTIWAGWISYRRIYFVLKNESNSEGKTQFSEISAAPTKRHAGSFSPVCDCVCFGGSALQDQLFSFLAARSLDLTSSMATGNTETIMIA